MVDRLVWDQEATGSSPVYPTTKPEGEAMRDKRSDEQIALDRLNDPNDEVIGFEKMKETIEEDKEDYFKIAVLYQVYRGLPFRVASYTSMELAKAHASSNFSCPEEWEDNTGEDRIDTLGTPDKSNKSIRVFTSAYHAYIIEEERVIKR